MADMTVQQWKSLLMQVGLSESDLQRWHCLFEQQNPAAHQSFLEWLSLDADSIAAIRNESN